jgi:hypothetical protein
MIDVAAPASHKTDICGYGSRRGGRDDGECVDTNFQTTKIVLATPRARGLQEILAPSKDRGRRECRMLDAPAATRAIKEKRTRTHKVHRKQTAFPAQWF